MRNALAKQTQQNAQILLSSKELIEANTKLNTLIALMKQNIGTNEFKGTIMIGNIELNEKTTQADLSGLNLQDNDLLPIRGCNNIRSLMLSDNQLTDSSLELISTLPQLSRLQLNNNKIKGDGLRILKQLKSLQLLQLRNNGLNQESLQHLKLLPHLQELALSNNLIGERGTKSIAMALNLTYLDVTHNQIDDEATASFQTLNLLKHCYLMSNKITIKGVKILFKSLKSIEVLDLRFNLLTQEDKDQLKTILPQTIMQVFL